MKTETLPAPAFAGIRYSPTRHRACRLVAFLFGLAGLVSAAPAQTTLTGTVTNAATGRALEAARVAIDGTSRETLTDSQGAYRFDDLPTGAVTLVVAYTGLDTATVQVAVQPGANRRDVGLTSQIYAMSQFVVSGEREGNAQAVTLQRVSSGVKNIVSTDAFGNLAGNPADLLVRLPGIEGTSVDGTIRYVRIRGLNQNLTTITMDGNRLADAASAGSTREFQFQTLGSDMIERMEVVKSPTPDMDGDSIGGAVNMVSKTGFDSSPERRLRGSFGVMARPFEDRADRIPQNFTLSYSEVFGGRLAVALNLGYRGVHTPQDTARQSYQTLPAGSTGPAYTYEVSFQDERLDTSRSGAGIRFDYKLSDRSRLYAGSTANKIIDHDTDRVATFSTGQAIATVDAAGNLTGTGGIVPGFTDELTQVRPVASSILTVQADTAYKDGGMRYHQLGGVHTLGSWNGDWNVYLSDSKTNYSGQRNIGYIARNIGFAVDRSRNDQWPTVTQTAGADISDLSAYTENRYRIDRRAGWDKYRGATLNAQKKFDAPVPSFIKAGVRVREQKRILESSHWSGTYVGPDGTMGVNPATGLNDDNLAQFGLVERGRFNNDETRFPNVPAPAFPGHTNSLLDIALATNPQYFRQELATNLQNQLIGNQRFKERISAAYVMGNIELGKLSVLAGVRVEKTETEGEGALQAITPEERARRAAFTGPLTDDEIRRRTLAEYGGRQLRTGDYQNVLPGVHFKYSPLSRLIVRLSYATNIGRPGIGQLVPRTNVNFENQTISTSNPSLEPQTADNFDLAAEYYFEPAGVVSVGLFHKEIKNFIYTSGGAIVTSGADNGFGGDYAGYTLTTQYNGGSAKVRGLELNYSQQFTFLPGVFAGLGAFANYTRMETEGNYGAGNAISLTPNPKGKVAGFNPETSNVGVSYIRNKISVRLQFNHRARFLSTYNVNDALLVYTIRRDQLDLKTLYQFSRRFGVYLDVNNILGEVEAGTDIGSRPQMRRLLSPAFFFGVNARL